MSWRDSRGAAVARKVEPLAPDSARLFPRQARAIDLNAVAHQESRLQTAPLSELVAEHAELGRWLELPFADLWSEQHAEKTERLKAIWQAIKRRFPEYARKQMRKHTYKLGEAE